MAIQLIVIRYIRAFEVARDPRSSKYEIHVKLRTLKNGPTVRNRLRLPHAIKTNIRICVICPPDSKVAQEALQAGASLVGEDEIFEAVKAGKIDFDRCICHPDSLQKMNKAALGRILGPRGLMPSMKTGTVTKDVSNAVMNMAGGSEYRERLGVVRLAVGQLAFTPEEVQRNIKTFMDQLKKDLTQLQDRISKEIHEVVSVQDRTSLNLLLTNCLQVLSSTNSPGFTLSGDFRSATSVPTEDLSVNDIIIEEELTSTAPDVSATASA